MIKNGIVISLVWFYLHYYKPLSFIEFIKHAAHTMHDKWPHHNNLEVASLLLLTNHQVRRGYLEYVLPQELGVRVQVETI